MQEQAYQYNEKEFMITFGAGGNIERLYDHIAQEIIADPHGIKFDNLKKPALHAFGQLILDPNVKDQAIIFMKTLPSRGSIVIGFKPSIIDQYKVDLNQSHASNELPINIPGGKLSLEHISGFESLGDFEDRVLERLGIF